MKKFSKDPVLVIIFLIGAALFLNVVVPRKQQVQISLDQPVVAPEMADAGKAVEEDKTFSLPELAREDLDNLFAHLELLGTIVGDYPVAFIFNSKTGQRGLYRQNDKIEDVRVASIMAGKIMVEKNGVVQQLLLTSKSGLSQEGTEPVLYTDSSGTMVVNKLEMMAQFFNAKQALGKVKIMPQADAGSNKLKGFKVDNVPSGSIIEEAGIKNGDIIYSVQGRQLTSMQDALEMFNKVQNQSRLEVVLMRDNKPVTLNYEIK